MKEDAMDLFSEKNNSGPLTEQTLRGEIDRIVYENEDNSYMVMKIRDAQGVEHTAVGNVSGFLNNLATEILK